MDNGDIDLTNWIQTSDSPLHSDNSDAGSPGSVREFGDLTIAVNENDNGNGLEDSATNKNSRSERNAEILQRISTRYNFLSTEVSAQ